MIRKMQKKINYKYETYKLRKLVNNYLEEFEKQKDIIRVLKNNQEYLKQAAEKAGTEKFKYKKEYIILLDKHESLKNELRNLKELRKGEKRKSVKQKPVKSSSNIRRK